MPHPCHISKQQNREVAVSRGSDGPLRSVQPSPRGECLGPLARLRIAKKLRLSNADQRSMDRRSVSLTPQVSHAPPTEVVADHRNGPPSRICAGGSKIYRLAMVVDSCRGPGGTSLSEVFRVRHLDCSVRSYQLS